MCVSPACRVMGIGLWRNVMASTGGSKLFSIPNKFGSRIKEKYDEQNSTDVREALMSEKKIEKP
jgi:hypothetical protein